MSKGKKKETSNGRPLIFAPKKAKLNFGNTKLSPPKTEYEDRKNVLGKDKVKKIIEGKYGKEE